jgi:hypothetical protein
MPTSSPPPSSEEEDEQSPLKEAERRRRRDLWRIGSFDLPLTPGWGERLLPFVFAATETCWIDAVLVCLASIHFFELREPLLPLWTPFILIAGSSWLVHHLERRALTTTSTPSEEAEDGSAPTPGSSTLFILASIVVLVSAWSSIYASTFSLIDPRWLLALFNDILLLSAHAYHFLGIALCAIYFCWRGITLARRPIEPGKVLWMLRIGIAVFVVAIIIRAGAGSDYGDGLFLFLLPLFFSFVLLAHALSKAVFMRQSHTSGLSGSTTRQERAILTIVGAIGILLLVIALAVGTFASPTFLAQVQTILAPVGIAYGLLVTLLAHGLVLLATPVIWLISQLHLRINPGQPLLRPDPGQIENIKSGPPPQELLLTVAILEAALPLLLILLGGFLIWRLLRRRRITLRRRGIDLYESIWSWQLFWQQLNALLAAFWRRLFKKRVQQPPAPSEKLEGALTVRSIRTMYRELLRWTAERGYPRKKHETPYEFMHRLNTQMPQIEPELGSVTDAYMEVRYGEAIPGETEVARLQEQWTTLQKKS